ncbi:hypothetical protein SDC9_136035 [bioreactor metagenome]
MMNTVASTEYAVKWINGEVGDELDTKVLEELMTEYANGISVKTNTYVENSAEYPTFRLIMMDFLTYSEEDII